MFRFILITILSFSFVLNAAEGLVVNKTYEGKIYPLYTVYSYKNDKDVSTGFLGFKLKKVIETDPEALTEFRKYQVARAAGTGFMIFGFFSLFVGQYYLKANNRVDYSILYALSAMIIGYGIGHRYAYSKLSESVDIFNKNNEKEKPSEGKSAFLLNVSCPF